MTRGHIFLARNRYTGLQERVYVAHRDRVKQVDWLLVSLLSFCSSCRLDKNDPRSHTKPYETKHFPSCIFVDRFGLARKSFKNRAPPAGRVQSSTFRLLP